MRKCFLYCFFVLTAAISAQDHLLITEFVVTPTAGEFIEIHNPTENAITLSDYFLTDATNEGNGQYYYNIVTGVNAGDMRSDDFHARFPDGASIAPGEFQTIAMNGSGFFSTYNIQATYELFDTDANVPDMREALPGAIGGSSGLTNGGEIVILYHWDGTSDLVQDTDYAVWGDKAEAVDKTGIAIDGPDGDSSPSTYLDDTAIANQIAVSSGAPHSGGESAQRMTLAENGEIFSGGNGITGHDETSEDLATSFERGDANPGSGPGGGGNLPPVISNLSHAPENPTPSESVIISATVIDDSTVTAVKLFYSVNSAPLDSIDMSSDGGNAYSTTLAPQANGDSVSYFLIARDDENLSSTSAAQFYLVSAGGGPPQISNIIQSPSAPAPEDIVTITADVTDDGTVTTVKLHFAIGNAPFDSTDMTNTSGSTHTADIAMQSDGVTVSYFISARDDGNLSSVSPTRSYTVSSGPDGGPHLLISEIVVTPTAGEFIEIYNPTSNTVDLSNYYLTDATFASGSAYYYNIVTGANAGGGSFSDFHARFPEGATIASGETQTIAMDGTAFLSVYTLLPTYELYDTNPALPDMREALPGSIDGQGGLTDAGEVAILYFWNGQTDLVQDIDYVVWGDKAEAVDKTGISIDGPDADNTPSTYLDDTAIAQQISVSSDAPHTQGRSVARPVNTEVSEAQSGGNGLTGHNETAEDLASAFPVSDAANPGVGPGGNIGDGPTISDISQSPASPSASDAVTVSANISDNGSVQSADLHVSVNSAPFDSSAMTVASGDLYEGSIAAQPEGSIVQYFIRARDDEGKKTTSQTFSYTITGTTQIADIKENLQSFLGEVVTVQGIVTLGAGRVINTRTDAYVQDASGRGINIFGFGTPDEPPNDLLVRGNELRITGTVDEFGGVAEIIDYAIDLISTGNEPPAPLELTTAGANNISLEGTYIETSGTVQAFDSFADAANITLNDGSAPVTVRVWATTGIDLSQVAIGEELTVQAVMDLFNSTAQLIPGYQDEIMLPNVMPGDGSGTAAIQPDSVGVGEAVSGQITITGTADYVIETITISVPGDWSWISDPANVQLSGDGLASASLSVQGFEITISQATLTDT